MNPWGFVAIALGVILIVIGIKGTQHKVTGALTGHQTGGSGTSTAATTTYTPSTTGVPSGVTSPTVQSPVGPLGVA